MSDYDQQSAGQRKQAEDNKQQFSEIETIVFDLDISKLYRHRIEHYSGKDGLIVFDEQFLLDENDDPEKVLQELKKKQQRLNQIEEEEKKLSDNIKKTNKEVAEKKEQNEESEAFRKIKEYLNKSPAADRLDFTQNMLKMAQELGKQLTVSGILPSFKLLATDNDSIKVALIEQVNSIASFLIQSVSDPEYQQCLEVIVPILNDFLYDKNEKVKKKAVKALVEFWDKLTPDDRGDYILKFMLELAHEEKDDKARVSALRILNKVAGKLDVELCEKFIVKEIKSLAIDPSWLVRKSVASNLNNVCKSITRDWFLQEIFPLLKQLGEDNDEDVRNSWVEQVSKISSVWPVSIRTGQLEKLYIQFMQDKSKKVKTNSFKHLGKFLETLKDLEINHDFLQLYTEIGMRTKTKDILYYWAYNIPGILYILKVECWPVLEELYMRLAKSSDPRIKKTLAYSIHEIAKLIGQKQTEEILIKILHQYLRDGLKEVRAGIIKVRLINYRSAPAWLLRRRRPRRTTTVFESVQRGPARPRNDRRVCRTHRRLCAAVWPGGRDSAFASNIFQTFWDEVSIPSLLYRLAHVRKLAGQNLSKILDVYHEDHEKQIEIIKRVLKDFWQSKVFYYRQVFIYMAASVMNSNKELFEKYLKKSFWNLGKNNFIYNRL